jgi:tetratricopeptide (TPR) repeat protein
MEIHLLLEGEQVGPLSEAQVREYMDQGLVTADDLASHVGMDDWMPLERVLARIPKITPAPQAAPPPFAESAPEPKPASAETSPTPEESASGSDSSFLVPNAASGPVDAVASSPAPTESLPPLTATQKTRRKLGKIVIQPILPLETPPLQKKKSGKTAITLEPMRSTIALPSVGAHQPRKAARTGKVSLRITPPPGPDLPGFESKPDPETEPSLISPETAPAAARVETQTTSVVVTPEAAPIEVAPPSPAPDAGIEIKNETKVKSNGDSKAEAKSETAPVTSAPPEPPNRIKPPADSAATKLPDPAPVFSVLPKDSPFVPPSIRTLNGMPPRRKAKSPFPYAAIAVAAFILAVIITCICLFAWRGETAPAPNPFRPQTSTAPPIQPPNAAPEPTTPTTSELGDRGMKLQAAGDLDGAIQVYDQALVLDPKAVEIYYRRGLARQAKQDLPGAMADYTQVVALNPRKYDAFSNRGFIKQTQLDLDGALADYALSLAINPKQAVVSNNIGLIKAKKADLDGAIAAFGKAIDADPNMAFAFYNRGMAKNTEGNIDGAIADYTQALTLNPKIALAYRDRGEARQSKNDADGALADYNQALSLDPTLADAFYNRGLIKSQRGDSDGAINDNSQAITLDPTYAAAYNRRGLAWLGKGRLGNALADLKRFSELAPRDPAADNARIYQWVIATETNANGDADAELSTAMLNDWNSTPEDLTSKIGGFLLGHMSEADLIANAAAPDPARAAGQYCRVWYFAGMKRLLNGETPTASSYFQKSMQTGQKDLPEYGYARAEWESLNPGKPVVGN